MMMQFPSLGEYTNLTPLLEKLEKNELTLEDILDEDAIIQDIKMNNESRFLKFFNNKKIKKLIDYSTKLPASNEHNIGFKYPFNSTEILCCENINFQKIIMNEKSIDQENEIDIVNKIKKRDGFLFKLFEKINNIKQTFNNKENDDEDNEGDDIYEEDESEEIEDDDNCEENINMQNNYDNKESKKPVIIYENVDYLLSFLKASKETKNNYVLVGYFCKILTNLINIHSIKIVEYLYDYPKKDEFDILGSLVKNMNRRSMCNIIQKLLLFDDYLTSNIEDKKMNLLEKILRELNETNEKEKYESICESLSLLMCNKEFFDLFMKKENLLEIIYDILTNSKEDPRKSCSLLNLLIKINDNTLQHFNIRYTPNIQENNNNYLMPLHFDICYSNNKSFSSPEENNNIQDLKNFLLSYFNILEKNKFLFLEDLGNCDLGKNAEFMTTYLEPQKKIGIKKITQAEYFRTILDILINSYASGYHQSKIEQLINIANNQNIFWNLHNLFLLFPFSNIYQIYYNQIIEIVLNENSPDCLIDYFFTQKIENKNLIHIFIDEIMNNLKFVFKLTNTQSLNPFFSFIITILNKIFNTENLYLKTIIEKNRDLSLFYEIISKGVQEIYEQKLLLSDQGINFGDIEDEALSSFGPKNFLELLEEDFKIYNAYKNGEDYETMLKAKNERIQKEKMEKEKEKEKKKILKIQYLEDLDEEIDMEEENPLFKVEKVNLENEKNNFFSLLNKPIEEIYKNENNKMDIGYDKKNKDSHRIDINGLEEDIEEKVNIIVDDNEKEKIYDANEILNEDLLPYSLENKLYQIDYHPKFFEDKKDKKEEKNQNELGD